MHRLACRLNLSSHEAGLMFETVCSTNGDLRMSCCDSEKRQGIPWAYTILSTVEDSSFPGTTPLSWFECCRLTVPCYAITRCDLQQQLIVSCHRYQIIDCLKQTLK
jgi:hypothetical protein